MNRSQILYFKFPIILILAGLIQTAGLGAQNILRALPAGVPAYSIRYELDKTQASQPVIAFLDQIDLVSDRVVKSIPIDPDYNSITFLDRDHLILCDTGGAMPYGKANIFDLKKEAVSATLEIEGIGPTLAIPAGGRIFVLTKKNNRLPGSRFRSWTAFEIFDRASLQKIGNIDLREGETVNESVSLSPDGKKLYFIGWNTLFLPYSAQGLIGMVDIGSGKLVKQFDYEKYFGGGRWVAARSDKLYVSASEADPKEDMKPAAERKLNSNLFIFNPDDLSLLKKVPIGILPEQMVYIPALDRLYIGHASLDNRTPQYLEVLDCKNDRVIAKITVSGFRRMAYVGNNKLYVSCSGGPLFGSNGYGGILVINIKTNKIIKMIPGEYAPLSYSFEGRD